MLNACVEISKPACEAVTTGNVIAVSVLWSFITLELISPIKNYGYIVLGAVNLICLIICCFYYKTENTVYGKNTIFNTDIKKIIKEDIAASQKENNDLGIEPN